MDATEALEGLVVAKVGKVAESKVNLVERFLKIFLASVGIEQEDQHFFVRKVWFKMLVVFFLMTVTCQVIKCFYLNNIGDIIQTIIFILHSLFLNFNTFSIYWKQKYILELLNIKVNNFSGFYESSLVMRNYMTADNKFKNFLIKYGIVVGVIHYFSSSLLPFFHFLFADVPIGSAETMILPSWYPWEINTVPRYLLTYLLQLIQTTALMLPSFANFLFIIYFVFEIVIQKSNLCTSLGNIVVYAYWESMSNESAVFQMLAVNKGTNKSYDDLLYEYLQDCIKHHILINSFIRNFIECYDLVFIGCLAYSVGNLSLLAYSLVLLQKEQASWTQYITPLEGVATVLAFLILYCFLGETVTSINNSVRNELYEIKWYEQSVKYRILMQTFMCLTQRDIVIKAGVSHIASYALFASVLRLSYSFFNILYTSV